MAEDLPAEGVKSYDELLADLAGYEEQQRQVEQLLLQDPENEELSEMYNSLGEVITLTKDLLADAKQQHAAAAAGGGAAAAGPGPSSAAAAAAAAAGGAALGAAQIATPAGAALPGNVADQIKKAQQRQALTGQAPAGWAVGAECLAYYAVDGQWYPAKVDAVTEDGKFVVTYEGYGNSEEVVPGSVRPRAEEVAEEVYRGVAAPKRKRVEEEPIVTEVPKWLEIKPEDDEKTVARKKKLLKSYKSKIRFQNMDLQQKEKQGSWQQFLKGKGSKGKTGFMTGKHKGSMPPDPFGDKKVTGFQKKGRHEWNAE